MSAYRAALIGVIVGVASTLAAANLWPRNASQSASPRIASSGAFVAPDDLGAGPSSILYPVCIDVDADGPCWPTRSVSVNLASVSDDGKILIVPGLTDEQRRDVIKSLKRGGYSDEEIAAGQADPVRLHQLRNAKPDRKQE